ncbi:MAG: LamG-like jellyroll fold domain-containing protein [Bacteroidota bacterium]
MRFPTRFLVLMLFPFVLQAQPCITNTSSLSFNAASVNFSTDTNLAPDTAITVEAWIRASAWALNVFDGSIVCKHSWSQGEQGYVLRAGGNGQVEFKVATSISWQGPVSAPGSMNLNTWYHVAGTYDGDSILVYINGVRQSALYMATGMIPGLAHPLRIGRLSDPVQSQTRYWNGQIDEVRVWNRALSATEILDRYDHHLDAAQETGLVGYWRLNEAVGSSVSDQTSNGNTGTLAGASWNTTLVPFNQTAATPIIFPNGNLLTSSLSASAYQWNLNGNPIPGATTQSWTAQANGNYTVTITDSLGCTATSAPYLIATAGLAEANAIGIDLRQENEVVYITGDGRLLQVIGVYTATGQLVANGIASAARIEIPTTGWSKGMYIVLISDAAGNRVQKKFSVR